MINEIVHENCRIINRDYADSFGGLCIWGVVGKGGQMDWVKKKKEKETHWSGEWDRWKWIRFRMDKWWWKSKIKWINFKSAWKSAYYMSIKQMLAIILPSPYTISDLALLKHHEVLLKHLLLCEDP